MADKTVLVVDDSPVIRQMVSFTLSQAGYASVQAGDGAEALKRLDAQRVNLVITDLNMPVMDGITFIRKLRARPDSRFTPVLMLTTESQAQKKLEGRVAGATGWIVKPFAPDQLLQVVAKVMR